MFQNRSTSMFSGMAMWARTLPLCVIVKSSSLSEAGSGSSMGTAPDDRAPWTPPIGRLSSLGHRQPCLHILLYPLASGLLNPSILLFASNSSLPPPRPPPVRHNIGVVEVCAYNVQWVREWRPMLIPSPAPPHPPTPTPSQQSAP